MSETPVQFRYQGHVAGLRSHETPCSVVEPAVVRRSPVRWVWGFVVGVALTGVVAVLGLAAWMPVLRSQEVLLPAPTVAPPAVADPPLILGTMQAPAVAIAVDATPPRAEVPTNTAPEGSSKTSQRRRSESRPPASPHIEVQLSLGIVSGVEPARITDIRSAVQAVVPTIQACCQSLTEQGKVRKGAISTKLEVRAGRVTAVNVDSPEPDLPLRLCFRRSLVGLTIGGGTEPLDARVEFFLLPRKGSPAAR